MKVKDLMYKHVISLRPDNTYEEAVKILYKNDIAGAPVVDEEDNIIGYVSEKDLFRILYPVTETITSTPRTIPTWKKWKIRPRK